MMLADSAGEPDVVANDSGLCVYVCVQPQNTAENRKVLLRITASVFRNIFTEAEKYCPTLTVSHPVSFLSSGEGDTFNEHNKVCIRLERVSSIYILRESHYEAPLASIVSPSRCTPLSFPPFRLSFFFSLSLSLSLCINRHIKDPEACLNHTALHPFSLSLFLSPSLVPFILSVERREHHLTLKLTTPLPE